MVCPTLGTSHRSGDAKVTYISLAANGKIYHVPLFRTGIHPRGLMLAWQNRVLMIVSDMLKRMLTSLVVMPKSSDVQGSKR